MVKLKAVSVLKTLLLLIIIIIALRDRFAKFTEPGKDADTYLQAITEFVEGKNPYQHTVKSYENIDDIGGHGYAYFPGFLYLFGILYVAGLLTGLPYDVLWKIPVLLADFGTAFLIYRYIAKKSTLAAVFGVAVWLLNPYLKADYSSYSLVDPIPILFILLALLWIDRDDVLTGVFFTLSVIFKPFALIFLPLFLIKSRNKINFVLACGLVFGAISLPFLTSFSNAITYLQGSLLVHSNRVLQGRPFLFYLSYFYKIELFQIIPLTFYSKMATFFGWVLIVIGYFLVKIRNIFILASLSALNFLIFTPVLNRTYLLWFLPIFILTAFDISTHFKKSFLYYVPLTGLWFFFYWYLNQWKDGFHVWHP